MAFKKKQVAKKTCSEAKVEAAKKKRKTCEGTKEALLRLQKLRVGGTWAMCSFHVSGLSGQELQRLPGPGAELGTFNSHPLRINKSNNVDTIHPHNF